MGKHRGGSCFQTHMQEKDDRMCSCEFLSILCLLLKEWQHRNTFNKVEYPESWSLRMSLYIYLFIQWNNWIRFWRV